MAATTEPAAHSSGAGDTPRVVPAPLPVRVPAPRAHTGGVRIAIRVRPGASRTEVAGAYGDALVVRVGARAVDGAATEAALAAVADAFGVRRREVTLVSGTTSRDKVVEVHGVDPELAARLVTLRDGI